MVRKSKGRQKISMVKMQNESNLLVTFSKRRSGLFKKASEICTLCGAEVALVVFSPGGKVYSFGHPSVESVIERFLTRNPQRLNDGTYQLVEAHRNASVRDLIMQLTQVQNVLEAERKRGESLDQMRKDTQNQRWWEAPIDDLNLQQLEQLKTSMEDLKKNVKRQVRMVMEEAANPFPYHPPHAAATIDSFASDASTAVNSRAGITRFNGGSGTGTAVCAPFHAGSTSSMAASLGFNANNARRFL